MVYTRLHALDAFAWLSTYQVQHKILWTVVNAVLLLQLCPCDRCDKVLYMPTQTLIHTILVVHSTHYSVPRHVYDSLNNTQAGKYYKLHQRATFS